MRAQGSGTGKKPGGDIRFTYSTPEQPRFKRAFIRSVELMGGQRRLKRLYDNTRTDRQTDETFFDVAMRQLAIDVNYDTRALAKVPKTGPVLFVANHPYGVLDGITLTWLATRVRPETKVLANSVLCRIPEAADNLLSIDFGETDEAMRTTLASRIEAQKMLNAGGAVGIFPGGGIATAPEPLKKIAHDLPWAPFTAKLIRASKATVVPIHFSGQNSRLFQLASHLSNTLRLSLMFRETARRIGTRLDVRIGEPITFSDLEHFENRTDMLTHLRRIVFALADDDGVDWMTPGRLKST